MLSPTSSRVSPRVRSSFGSDRSQTADGVARKPLNADWPATRAIGALIDAYNDRCQSFAWTKDADELLTKVRPSKN
jgi:hypothetical protein